MTNDDLAAKASLAAQVREFCKHPVFSHLKAFIDSKVNDAKNEWLKLDDRVKAEELRLKMKAYAEIEGFLKKLIIEGDVALHNLQKTETKDEI